MNSSTKSIYPLFESICLLNGIIQNRQYHSIRFKGAYQKFYGKNAAFDLFEGINIPPEHKKGTIKLRISYNRKEKQHSFGPYQKPIVKDLKIVHDNSIDYGLKFEDRSQLNALFEKRMGCDDILIIKNGWVTDSSYANIILWDGDTWYTPNTYLLKGTKRTQLLECGKIQETSIRSMDLKNFKGFQLINAMFNFNPYAFLPIEHIIP